VACVIGSNGMTALASAAKPRPVNFVNSVAARTGSFSHGLAEARRGDPISARRTRSADPNPINQLLFVETAEIILGDSLAPEKAGLVDVWTIKTLKSLLTPGGWVLLGMAIVLHSGGRQHPVAGRHPCFITGLSLHRRTSARLAIPFHSIRIFFALLVLFLARKALNVFSRRTYSRSRDGPHGAREHRSAVTGEFHSPLAGDGARIQLVQHDCSRSPAVCGIHGGCRLVSARPRGPGVAFLWCIASRSLRLFHCRHLPWLAFSAAIIVLLARFLLFRNPRKARCSGLWRLPFWPCTSAGREGYPLPTTQPAPLILAISIVETSYLLAYHDELTGLPSRRAFNQTLERLEAPISIAMVDI